MKRVVLLLVIVTSFALSATGWYSDYVIISVNGGESLYYWIGGDPSFGTELNGHVFTEVLSMQITGADMKYWSDNQDRLGGAFYWMVKNNAGDVLSGPNELIWTQSYLGGNDYQGSWSGEINVLSGLSGGKTVSIR